MSIIKKITILLGIFFISGVAQISAQEIKKIGKSIFVIFACK